MLFNSHEFLFGFFPAVIILHLIAGRWGERPRLLLLLSASMVFYAWWDVHLLGLLIASILANYALGLGLASVMAKGGTRCADRLLTLGVALNLLLLGVFKYANFTVSNVNALAGTDFVLETIILPLGISFFTFEQLGYLIDIRRGHRYPAGLTHYALFVSFFPRLVAGPILRYSEIEPQLAKPPHDRVAVNLAVGLTIFFIGLAKKVLLADNIAPYVAPVFNDAALGRDLDLFTAWGGALAYTFQLYFDFSGYSDMAVGAARCLGIIFPMNFFSPYKAASIVEFWRRWHITLSRFLRDYLYISLGGNRQGPVRRYANLLITMLLGGLWHGANWTFVFWGGLHGSYLIVNHAWSNVLASGPRLAAFRRSVAWRILAWSLTFLAVVVAWVFFRATSFEAGFRVLASMAGAQGAFLPAGLALPLQPLAPLLDSLGIGFNDARGSTFIATYAWIGALFLVALLAPSTQELLGRWHPVLEMASDAPGPAERRHGLARARWGWRPSPLAAIACGTIAFLAIISITRVSEFLYWQF